VNTYLEFEKSIADIDNKIDELSALAEASGSEAISKGVELTRLKSKAEKILSDLYLNLDPWQKTQVARHPDRPRFREYIAALVTDFIELSGDRTFAEDPAILGGVGKFMGRPALIIGHEKGRTTHERLKHNFGMARPEGYRKAIRLMDLADKFALPVVSLVDTEGAYPGMGAEERGQAEAIARSTERCLTLGVPMVAAVVGTGGSGGAIAMAAANKVLMLEHAIYSVITPEGAASILWRDAGRAKEAAIAMKVTAQDLLELGVIDAIIPEPLGGAHRWPEQTVPRVGAAIAEALDSLKDLSPHEVRRQRKDRFYKIGRFEEEQAALKKPAAKR